MVLYHNEDCVGHYVTFICSKLGKSPVYIKWPLLINLPAIELNR